MFSHKWLNINIIYTGTKDKQTNQQKTKINKSIHTKNQLLFRFESKNFQDTVCLQLSLMNSTTSFYATVNLLFLPRASSRFVTSNRWPRLIGFPKSASNRLLEPREPGFAQSKTHQNSWRRFWRGVPVKPYLLTRKKTTTTTTTTTTTSTTTNKQTYHWLECLNREGGSGL